MPKLCFVIVLLFIIKTAVGDCDEDHLKCNCTVSNKTFFTPRWNKNYIFSEIVNTPTMEQKILQRLDMIEENEIKTLQRLDLIVNSLNVLVEINEKIDTLSVSLKSLEPITQHIVHPRNCRKALFSGIYEIQVGSQPFKVFCEQKLYDGGWTVVARRMDGSVNFADRNWTDYKDGFGDLESEFFIGLDKLYMLTNGPRKQELIFVLRDFDDEQRYAKYSEFAIGDESEGYKIKALGSHSGNVGSSFWHHRNQTFKTKDRDTSTKNCSQYGAWWYNDCYTSNLFGSYLQGHVDESNDGKGIVWVSWHSWNYSLKFVQIMIRSSIF